MNELTFPSKSSAVSTEVVLDVEQKTILMVPQINDIDALDDARKKAHALALYVQGKELKGPVMGAERRIEARIGQLLGEAKRGKELHGDVKLLHHANRHDFRILAHGFDVLDGNEWRQSRSRLISLIRTRVPSLGREPQPFKYAPEIHFCDLGDLPIGPGSVDAIITDPPYPKEYLAVYERLAVNAAEWLTDTGSLVVMCGHIYLPEILAMMTPHIQFNWILAYMVPGESGSAFTRGVRNIGWKPVLHFCKGEPNIGYDVVASERSESHHHHEWGQSESGMKKLIELFSKPDDLIVDPFLGGGTTAVCAGELGRRFIGCDIDPIAVETTNGRLHGFRAETETA